MGVDKQHELWYNTIMIRNNGNTKGNEMLHINSIYSTFDGGYSAEFHKSDNAYRIIIQRSDRTYVHYSSTEQGCYDYLYNLVR
jgi:hypothetical protein